MGSQNIFAAQRSLETKITKILQGNIQMQALSCTSGQVPTIQVGLLAMDSASEPFQLDFTEKYTEHIALFKGLRNRGPFVLNGATIKAYTDRFKSRPSDTVKVRCSHSEKMLTLKSKYRHTHTHTVFIAYHLCIWLFIPCIMCFMWFSTHKGCDSLD